ncbi:uncharacterized protein LOC128997341 [Macrosteles quadrilineatus]|uniref:uncharacterized protein LOC128997341 n=1 Tax=Macrosteles quadrilineatus TaxID=74068 RepID=UPI0023E0B628|nr:uncharacterized protein LOC128997341 [Macrosteles quadrilineatus]
MNAANQMRLKFLFHCFGNLFVTGTNAKGILRVITLNDSVIKRIKVGIVGKIIIESDENDNHSTIEKVFYESDIHEFHSPDLINSEYDEQLLEFSVPLDSNLPPSVMLKQGGIIYYLYASMEETFQDEIPQNINTEANISVVNIVDCNTIPKAARDKSIANAPVKMCMCLTSDENSSSLQVSPRSCVPGDCLKINAVVFNSRPYPLCFVQAALVQKIKLKFENYSVKTNRVVSETKRGCVMQQRDQTWHQELLRVPPLPPTTYHKYLDVTYKLQLRVPERQNFNDTSVLLTVPVVIGSIPLEESLVHLSPLPGCESFGNNMLPIPKPYQEFARADRCIQADEGLKYVPSYITYLSDRAMDNVDLETSTPV